MCWAGLVLGMAAGLFAGIRIGLLVCEMSRHPGPGPGGAP